MKDKPVILVVDDYPQNNDLLEAYLVPQGYEIVKAANGEEALGKLSGNQIDLILLDVMMPGMDGFEVTRRVRQDNNYRLLPIILVTALRETQDRVKGIEAGCDDFISKPADKIELLTRVRSLLKVKAYNDLMSNYRKELESEVTRRTEELKRAFIFQQRLIDALPVPVFYKDSEGRYLGCNSSFEILYGQKREQVTGKSAYELFPKEFADIYHEKDLALLQNPGIQIYESVVKDTGGVVHNVIFHKATFPDMDDSGGGLIGAILDITDRKQAEESLRESGNFFKEITENSSDVIIITDKNGDIKYCSPSIERFTGYKPEELIGRNALTLIHPDDVKRAVGDFGKAILTIDSAIPNAFRIVHKEGSERYFGGLGKNLLDNPSIAGFIMNIRDITERKLAEEKLKDTLESLRKAVGTTVQVMVSAVETRDPYTAGHQIRSADLARAIATEMGLSSEKIEGIRMAGSIHDIGKLSVPAEILSKPTKLSDLEFGLIKEHARQGFEILKDVASPWPLAEIVHQHHERMDGSGYPRNLKGEEILIEARVLTVADVVEAMASHRPYRPGLGIDAALNEIEKNRGIFYDDVVADACLRLFREKGFKLEGT